MTSFCSSLIDAGRIADVVHRVAGRVELHALKLAGQEAAVPLPRRDRLRRARAGSTGQHDEAGQVIAFAAQAVVDPRAHARAAGDGRARVHEGVGRVVIDLLGLHRADDADVVGDAADVGQIIADRLLRLPNLLKVDCGPKQSSFLALQLRDRLAFGERLGHRLAVHFGELRLVVEQFQMRGAAGHAQEDHSLGFLGKMQRIHGAAIGCLPAFAARGRGGAKQTVVAAGRRARRSPGPTMRGPEKSAGRVAHFEYQSPSLLASTILKPHHAGGFVPSNCG